MRKILTLLVTSLLLANTAWAGNPETLMAVGLPAQTASTINTLYGTGLTASMTPATDNAIDLGSASKQFRSLYLGTNLIFGAASAKIIPGATSLLIRNNADSASNLAITNAGVLTLAPLSQIILPTTLTDTEQKVVFGQAAKVSDQAGAELLVSSDVNYNVQMMLQQSTADTNGVIQYYNKTRKTDFTADTIVASGDNIAKIIFNGADGASFRNAAGIIVTVDGTPGSSDMPGAIDFQTTPDGSATLASALKLSNTKAAVFGGAVTSAATGALGWSYVTGANTACTTTCTFAAVFGVDLAAGASAPVIVDATSATADACVCAGAS